MKKIISTLILISIMLCLQRTYAENEDAFIETNQFASLVRTTNLLLAVANDGSIKKIDPTYLSFIDTLVSIDPETEFPVYSKAGLQIYKKMDNALQCIWPESESHLFILPNELSVEDWTTFSWQQWEDSVFFLYQEAENETNILCRYDMKNNNFQWIFIKKLNDYFIGSDGTTYAVSYNEKNEETTILQVDWQRSVCNEVFSLTDYYTQIRMGNNCFYAIRPKDSSFVQLGKTGDINVSLFSPFASSVLGSTIIEDKYWVLGSYGLFSPIWETQSNGIKKTIRIPGSGPNPIDQEFLLQHPDLQIEYIPSTAYESVGLYNAIMTDMIKLDICTIDTSAAAESFLNKGYSLDLSMSPVLLEKAQKMYEPIKQCIFNEGKLRFIPYSIDLGNILEYCEDSFMVSGMSIEEIPHTIEELLDLIINWGDYNLLPLEKGSIVPILFDESPHYELLLRVIKSYTAYCRHIGTPLSFNTTEFRRLLKKTRVAAAASSVQTKDYNPARLFIQVGRTVPSIYSVTFPVVENETPRYTGRYSGWAICADAQNPDIAVEYIIFRMEKVTKAMEVLLFDKVYDAIERDSFLTQYAEWNKEHEKYQTMLLNENNPTEKLRIQEHIDQIEALIEHPDDNIRFEITSAEISFYQNEIVPNIEFSVSDPITDSSASSLWAQFLMKQYVEGMLSDDAFIRELDNRIWMMQMEAGEI